uniref:Uncharacterized protein n=1 Tax=Spongospora subterranea TaxID=70186 RepID=A0A0H5R3Q8_9EUKA|eukprot:CRZ08820.1 hypothetical protein [Spongospora subterranea]
MRMGFVGMCFRSESELLEEPVDTGLGFGSLHVSLLELGLDGLAGGDPGAGRLHGRWRHHGADVHVDRITGRHNVLVVDVFHERFDLGAFQDLLLRHGLGHFLRVLGDAHDQSVAEFALLMAVVEGFHDDRLATGIST